MSAAPTPGAQALAAEVSGAALMDTLRHLARFVKLAGTPAELESLQGLQARLAAYGYATEIVFHDAYQYFENRYHIRVAGSITVSPETLPGADRISQIHKKVTELGATCVFSEPQFEPKLINVVLEGTPAKSGTLDPEAATLTEGPNLYFDLMRGIATSLTDCLKG